METNDIKLEKVPDPDILHIQSDHVMAPRHLKEVRFVDPGLNGYDDGDRSGIGRVDALREIWLRIRKHKLLIIIIVIIATSIVTLEVSLTPPWYQATTLIEIGRDNPTVVGPNSLVMNDYDDPFRTVNLETKKLMLESRTLHEDVVINLGLDQNPNLLRVGKGPIRTALDTVTNRLFKLFKLSQSAPQSAPVIDPTLKLDGLQRSPAESARLETFVLALEENLDIDDIRDTRALQIKFKHTDPSIALGVVNSIAQLFIQRNFQNQTDKYTNAADWLENSTRELKVKVEAAEQALTTYTREHKIFSTASSLGDNQDGKSTLTIAKLTQLHDQTVRAETDRLLKKSLYEQVKAGRIADLPDAFTDPKLTDLRRQLNGLSTTAAELKVRYGSLNPKLIEVEKQMDAVQEQIDANLKLLEQKLKTDYERAVSDEQSLKAVLQNAKAEAINENQAAIQYSILKQDVETARALYVDFLQKTNQAKAQLAGQNSSMRFIQPPRVPTGPAGPRTMPIILIAFFSSLWAGVGLSFYLEYLDKSIKSVEDVDRYTRLPALGAIPAVATSESRPFFASRDSYPTVIGDVSAGSRFWSRKFEPALLMEKDQYSPAAEAYRALRTSVLLSATGEPPKTILITSGNSGEGKTTTAINTAMSLAYLGKKILLLDCDLRGPTLHKILDLDNERGLSTFLSNDVDVDHLIQDLPIQGMSILTSGPIAPNPAELISSQKMKNMLSLLAQRYDHILIDSPPILAVTDSVILSTIVDGVILVVHGGKTSREVVQRSRKELSSVGAHIFGVVLNNSHLSRKDYKYYYRS